jgi:T4 RnlA family RNA ligase
MRLNLQKFLKIRSLEDLRKDPFNLHINAKDNLIIFKYNQFNSDFSNKIVKESRGIILEKETWNIVAHPFDKFFNYGETYAYNLTLDDSYILEKVDGSIMKVYFYDGEWRIATNGTIDANDASNNDGITFTKIFFDVIDIDKLENLVKDFSPNLTYIFELIHPSNQIVVDYEGVKELVFIGLKENDGDLRDFNIFHKSIKKKYEKLFKGLPIRFPRLFNLKKVKDVSELSEIADKENEKGNEFEGYVVTQIKDNLVIGRVKVKSPKYIQLHHVVTGESVTNNLIRVLLENEEKEFEVYLDKLPDVVKDEYKLLKKKYFDLIEYLSKDGDYYRKKASEMNRKDLALDIQVKVNRDKVGFMFTMVDNLELSALDVINGLYKQKGVKRIKNLLIEKKNDKGYKI